MVDKGDPST